MKRTTQNLVGKKFHKLTVIAPTDSPSQWHVLCDCGNKLVVRGNSLTTGNTKSCGCLRKRNPGRPRKTKTKAFIPLLPFVNDTHVHLTPLRQALLSYGVKVGVDSCYYVQDKKYGPFASPYHAIAEAILRCLKGSGE